MRLFLSFCFVFAAFVAEAQTLTLDTTVVDYGKIAVNADGHRLLNFRNTGSEPLIIESIRGGCSCSIADWPKEPILPNASGTIKVLYDTKRLGRFTKPFVIRSNADNGNKFGEHLFTIKGEVSKTLDEEIIEEIIEAPKEEAKEEVGKD
jgi:hypothetical protein